MLRRWKVTWKILATLAVPILVLLAAATYISVPALQEERVARQSSALVDALQTGDAVGRAVVGERTATLALLATDPALTRVRQEAADTVAKARTNTDESLISLAATYADLDISALDPAVKTAVERTLATGDDLRQVREQVDVGGIDETGVVRSYEDVITTGVSVLQVLADTTDDRDLAPYLRAYVLSDKYLAQIALEKELGRIILDESQGDKEPDPAMLSLVSTVFSEGDAKKAQAADAVQALNLGMNIEVSGDSYETVRANLKASKPKTIAEGTANKWTTDSDGVLAQVSEVREKVRETTVTKAASDADSARQSALITIGIAVVSLGASILIAALIARTISRPLRRLTVAAQEVRDELPGLVEQVVLPGEKTTMIFEPIEVDGRDEIGQLAVAFNDVNAQTLSVAREQAALRGSIAELFVNVARRDQVLLNRQLAFLDDLERSETDPGTLSNLFRLDHLATRMRRNAESLLVLAGIDSGRRVRQPMALSDVVRTASSEIELFDRVRLELAIDPLILGHNALNAAHLIAELLENATMFSEPHTPVEVAAAYDGQYVRVTVRDHGLGMSLEEIEEANRRVSSTSATEVMGAQRLGLYVVGRLADRLGSRITFVTGRDGAGTEAIVDLPISLFAADSHTDLAPELEQFDLTGPREAEPTVPEPLPVEVEPPAALPVDLDSLTDGTTTSGMPRRRSRSAEHAAPAPSATVSQTPQTGAIVLPPLVTPNMPIDLPQGEDSWAPPEDITVPGGALPSRHRATVDDGPTTELLPGPINPADDETPILDVDARTSLFSRFRSMGGMDPSDAPTDNPVELAPAADASATDISVPSGDESTSDEWTPTFAFEGDSSLTTRPASEQNPVPDFSTTAGLPVFSSEPLRGPEPESPFSPTPALFSPDPAPYTPDPAPFGDDFSAAGGDYGSLMDAISTGIDTQDSPDSLYQPTFIAETPAPIPAPAVERSSDWLSALTDETVMLQPRTPEVPDEAPAPPIAAAPVPDPAPDVNIPEAEPVEFPVPVDTALPFAIPSHHEEPELGELSAENFAFPDVAPLRPRGYAEDVAAYQPEPQSTTVEEIPEDLRVEALPRFEDLMSDLPTRRNGRETNAPRRGLFGRRPRTGSTAHVADPSVASQPAQEAFPVDSGYEFVPEPAYEPRQSDMVPPSIPLPVSDDQIPAVGEPYAPTPFEPEPYVPEPYTPSSERFMPDPVGVPTPPAGVESFEPDSWSPPIFAPEPALAPADNAYAFGTGALDQVPLSTPDPDGVDAHTASLPVFGSVPMDTAARTPRHEAEPAPEAVPSPLPIPMYSTGDAFDQEQDLSNFGAPTPLTRRRSRSYVESDPRYGDDSVEARSEWTASAVLYEEMNSLLRSTGTSSEASALERPAADAYQPLRMETDGQYLSRRPMENREGYVDRFTARIDRDPEQLRARLAAFQSATARGRAEAQDETDVGQVPGNGSDQAPQPR